MEGCPIRKSPGQSVSDLPKPIVAYYVLHRLQVPRHPPYALSNLTTQVTSLTNIKSLQLNAILRHKMFSLPSARKSSLTFLKKMKKHSNENVVVFLTLYAVFKVLNSKRPMQI